MKTMRWSRISPQAALMPAVAVTLVAFVGSILWTVYLSFTRSRRLPEYGIDWSEWGRQYNRLFRDAGWEISLRNLIVLGLGSALAIVFGFILAAMIDKEKRGESLFRTLDPQSDPGRPELSAGAGLGSRFQLAGAARYGDVRHHSGVGLAERGLLHGPDAGRAQRHQF